MTEQQTEYEGTWEELAEHGSEFGGRRLRLTVLPVADAITETPSTPRKSIEDEMQEVFADVPQEEWDRLPSDLCDQLDHYIYGTPKR